MPPSPGQELETSKTQTQKISDTSFQSTSGCCVVFASAIDSSVGGWSYWLWKQPGHQVDHTRFSGVNEQLEGSRLARTPGVSVVVGVEKRLPGWGSLFRDGLRGCKGSGLWLLGNVSSLNGDELTMRTTLQDDNGEEGDVQGDRRGWIGQLLARENGTGARDETLSSWNVPLRGSGKTTHSGRYHRERAPLHRVGDRPHLPAEALVAPWVHTHSLHSVFPWHSSLSGHRY